MLIRNEFARAGFCKSVLVGEKDLNNCIKQCICLSKVSSLFRPLSSVENLVITFKVLPIKCNFLGSATFIDIVVIASRKLLF